MRPHLTGIVGFIACLLFMGACGSGAPGPTAETPTVVTSTVPATTVRGATPSVTAASSATVDPKAPRSGRWIDVDVTRFTVRLMDGEAATMTISPVAVGAQIDTGIYNSTATGLFHVYSKTAALTYDAPYDTYISNWVGFDPSLDNGFHSFLEDANGKVVDASTGRVSNGCIRTGESAAIYSFAQIGMPVYVHA